MFFKKIQNLRKAILLIRHSEFVQIQLDSSIPDIHQTFAYFTKRHPKLKIIPNKTKGLALIVFSDFGSSDEYIHSVNGKNSAAYYSRRAEKKGFSFSEIDPNHFCKAIFEINTSAPIRQNRKMTESYSDISFTYPINPYNIYFGVFSGEKLVAYIWIKKLGEVIQINRILGHQDYLNDGIMYLLVTKTVNFLLEIQSKEKYIMYDSFLGNSDGLALFKKRTGFNPYNVKWIMQ